MHTVGLIAIKCHLNHIFGKVNVMAPLRCYVAFSYKKLKTN